MKINESQRVGGVNPYTRAQGAKPGAGAGGKGKVDEVQISSAAKELLGAKNSEEYRKRIEELKQQVSAGTYHVEAGKIADKLLPYFK
ncbi:flagellar biosynthesis anti-sigma factor FlgM [Paenibacillus chartarius]|uniref:Negative regulator of flagellin synthesis n=1 Tax=Paenibacillus chartarius TaxID=747481 RepID=A0ABV6DJU7_9BACL